MCHGSGGRGGEKHADSEFGYFGRDGAALIGKWSIPVPPRAHVAAKPHGGGLQQDRRRGEQCGHR